MIHTLDIDDDESGVTITGVEVRSVWDADAKDWEHSLVHEPSRKRWVAHAIEQWFCTDEGQSACDLSAEARVLQLEWESL